MMTLARRKSSFCSARFSLGTTRLVTLKKFAHLKTSRKKSALKPKPRPKLQLKLLLPPRTHQMAMKVKINNPKQKLQRFLVINKRRPKVTRRVSRHTVSTSREHSVLICSVFAKAVRLMESLSALCKILHRYKQVKRI